MGNPNNPGFLAHLAAKSDNHKTVRELVYELLLDQTQPLTAKEVRELAVQSGLGHGYRKFDSALVRNLLLELIRDGLVYTRVETPAERSLRSDGKTTTGQCAALYSVESPVPARTERIAVPGVYLAGTDERSYNPRRKRRRAKAARTTQTVLPTFEQPTATGTGTGTQQVADLIEQLVAARTVEYRQRAERAEAKLQALEKLLRG